MDATKFNICPDSKARIRERFFKLCNNRQTKVLSLTDKEITTKVENQPKNNIILEENEDGFPMITSVFSLAESDKIIEQSKCTSSFNVECHDKLLTFNQKHTMTSESHNLQNNTNSTACVTNNTLNPIILKENGVEKSVSEISVSIAVSPSSDEGKIPMISKHDDKIRRLKDLLRQQEKELEKVRFKSKTNDVLPKKMSGKKDLRIRLLKKTSEHLDFPIESYSKTESYESRTRSKRKCDVQESEDCLAKRQESVFHSKLHCNEKISPKCVTIARTNHHTGGNETISTMPYNLKQRKSSSNDAVNKSNLTDSLSLEKPSALLTVEGLQKEIRNLAAFFRNQKRPADNIVDKEMPTSVSASSTKLPSNLCVTSLCVDKPKNNVMILPVINTGTQETVTNNEMLLQPVQNEKGQTLFYITQAQPPSIAIGSKVVKETKAKLEHVETNKCQIVSSKKLGGKSNKDCGFLPNGEDEDFTKLLGLEYVVHTLNC